MNNKKLTEKEIADIKLKQAIVMAKPKGLVIDLLYLRSVLKDINGKGFDYTEQELLDAIIKQKNDDLPPDNAVNQ